MEADPITWQLRLVLALRCLKMSIPLTPVLFPWYETVGIGIEEVFWLSSISSFVTVCCEVPSGYIADTMGRSKTLTAAFMLLSLSQVLLLGAKYVSHPSLMVFAAALLRPLGTVLFSGTDTAIVHELTSSSERHHSHGTESSHIFTVLMTEAAVHIVGSLLTSSYGMEMAAVVSIIPPVVAALLTFLIKEVHSRTPPSSVRSESSRRSPSVETTESQSDGGGGGGGDTVPHFEFITSVAPLATLNALSFMSTSLCPLVWKSVGVGISHFGLLTCSSLLSASIGSLCSPWFVQVVPGRYLCPVLAVGVSVAYTLFSSDNIPLSVIGNLTLGFTRGVMWPLATTSINSLVSDAHRVTALSLFCAVSKVACMLLSPAVGHLVTLYGVQMAAAIHALVGLLVCMVSLVSTSSVKEKVKTL